MTVTSFNIYQQITSVRLVSIDNLSGIYYNGQLNNGVGSYLLSISDGLLTIDGENVNLGDRLLLLGQTNTNENGIYIVDQPGDVVTPFLLKRAPDLQNIEQLKIGQYFSVGGGASLAGALYVIVEPLPDIIGVDPIIFIESSAGGAGPFLRVDENLADVSNKVLSYQNLGFGAGSQITLTDADFVGGIYELTNPCPNYVFVSINNPLTNGTIILPPDFGTTAFNLNEGVVILNTGSESFFVDSPDEVLHATMNSGDVYRFYLLDILGVLNWELQGIVYTVNGKTGFVEISSSTRNVYVSQDGNDTTGSGSILNPYRTVSKAMSVITTASPTNPFSIIMSTGIYSDTSLVLKSNVFIYGNSSTLTVTNPITLNADWSGGGYGGIFDLYNADFQGGITLDFNAAGATSAVFSLKNIRTNFANTWSIQGKKTTGSTRLLIDSIYSAGLQPDIFIIDCLGYSNNVFSSEFRVINNDTQNTSFSINNLTSSDNLLVQSQSSGDLTLDITNSHIKGTATFEALSTGACESTSYGVIYDFVPTVNNPPAVLNIDLSPYHIIPTNSATVNLVAMSIKSWNGSTEPIQITSGDGIDITDGIITAVVNTWDGSNTPVDVTAGSGIDITDGVISLDGTGASAAYGYLAAENLSDVISFTDTTTWKPLVGTILSSEVNNFVVSNDTPGDPTTPFYLQYVGLETGAFEVCASFSMRRFTNTDASGYYISISLDGVNPLSGTFGDMQLSYGCDNQGTANSKLIPYTVQLSLDPNDKIYFIVQNGGPSNVANDNDFLNTQCIITAKKIGDVGGSTAGVTSLNGLTGNVDIISDGSITISTVGNDVSLSSGQYIQVAGTSQAMLANKSYICMNSATTSLSLPTSNCPVGSYIEIAGYGGTTGLFIITQSAGQQIFFGPANTTLGVTGTLTPDVSNYLSAIKIVCVEANNKFMVVNSQGNFVLA